jgi:RNA polymerase sigma factor (sigma-70 family)
MIGEHSDGPELLAQKAAQEAERLVAAIAQGDPDAERDFVLRYQKPVKAMLLARTRNPDLTADLQQDVLIEAVCALRRGQLREAAKLSAFVIGVARNQLNNYYRSNKRTETLELPEDLPDLSSGSERVEEQERETLAMNAISSLDKVDREILQLTLIDGLKPGVIAERLRMNPDVVRQRKLRATRRVTDFVRRLSQTEPADHNVVGRVT